MYYISEFCRICLQYDKNLIDIVKIENEPTETLLNKLKLCVSEVVSCWKKIGPIKYSIINFLLGVDVQQHSFMPVLYTKITWLLRFQETVFDICTNLEEILGIVKRISTEVIITS